MITYLNYREKYITRQIGYTYAYDATKEDDWKICGASDITKSSEFNRNVTLNERPIKRLITENGKAGKLIKKQTGRYLFDFKEEYTGDFRIDFEANKEKQLLHICWGEHIVDGLVRDKIEEIDFYIDY